MQAPQVSRKTRTTAASLVFGTDGSQVEGWQVVMADEAGAIDHFSKLDGSNLWRHDARFLASGMPVFVHGFGSSLSWAFNDDSAAAQALDAIVAEVA